MISDAMHKRERSFIVTAFRQRRGREPTTAEAQLLQSVSWLETRYGTAWKSDAGRESKNRGAVQYKTPRQLGLTPPYPDVSPDGRGFLYTDTSPNDDGSSTPYSVYFRRYESDEEAVRDLVQQVYDNRPAVLQAASEADVLGFSRAMYESRYYEGFGRTKEERIANHHKAVKAALRRIANALGEPLPDGSMPLPRTIERGSSGVVVKDWQAVVDLWLAGIEESGDELSGAAWRAWVGECEERGAAPYSLASDGLFGEMTDLATRAWQEAHGLKVDGIVGPNTWGAAQKGTAPTEPPPIPDEDLLEKAAAGDLPDGVDLRRIVSLLAARVLDLEKRRKKTGRKATPPTRL